MWPQHTFQVKIPFRVTGSQERTIGLMLPHELFSTMFHEYNGIFNQLMAPEGSESLKTFWSTMRQHPGMQGHPILSVPSFDSRTIPINVHGDCVPITGIGKVWSKNLLALRWSSALCKGNSKDICMLIYTASGQLYNSSFGLMIHIGGTWQSFVVILFSSDPRFLTSFVPLKRMGLWIVFGKLSAGALMRCFLASGLTGTTKGKSFLALKVLVSFENIGELWNY